MFTAATVPPFPLLAVPVLPLLAVPVLPLLAVLAVVGAGVAALLEVDFDPEPHAATNRLSSIAATSDFVGGIAL